MGRRHMFLVATAALALVVPLSGCGGDGSQADGPAAERPDSHAPDELWAVAGSPASTTLVGELMDPGDDLLGRARSGVVFEGTSAELSWRFPEGWTTADGRTAVPGAASAGGADGVDISVVARPGTTHRDLAVALAERPVPGGSSDINEIEVDGVAFSVVGRESPDEAAHLVLWSPDTEQVTYAVVLHGPAPMADTDADLLRALAQVVGSLEHDDRPL